jgi:hypothetical protein
MQDDSGKILPESIAGSGTPNDSPKLVDSADAMLAKTFLKSQHYFRDMQVKSG